MHAYINIIDGLQILFGETYIIWRRSNKTSSCLRPTKRGALNPSSRLRPTLKKIIPPNAVIFSLTETWILPFLEGELNFEKFKTNSLNETGCGTVIFEISDPMLAINEYLIALYYLTFPWRSGISHTTTAACSSALKRYAVPRLPKQFLSQNF